MHRALMDAIAFNLKHNEARVEGFIFTAHDAIVLPWNIQSLNLSRFWVPPLWQIYREKTKETHRALFYTRGPYCGRPLMNRSGAYEFQPCAMKVPGELKPPSSFPSYHPLSSSTEAYVGIESKPWHAEAALKFCSKMTRIQRQEWDKNIAQTVGSFGQTCSILQSGQSDVVYIPMVHAEVWLDVVHTMDKTGWNFHHIFPTAPAGLVSAREIEALVSHYSFFNKDCVWMAENFPDWHVLHPCKWVGDEHLQSKIRLWFMKKSTVSKK